MKTKTVAILNAEGEICGYLASDASGQPCRITGNFKNAYHFTGSLSVDLVTPEHAGNYFCQEHRGITFVAGEEREFDYSFEIQEY